MNLDSLSFALSGINFAVANLSRKNYKSANQELSHFVSVHGVEAERHLLSCLFSHIDLSGESTNKVVGQSKESYQVQYLIKEFDSLITRPNFVSTLCFVFDNLLGKKVLKTTPGFLSQLSQVLKLSRVQEIAFGIALQESSDPELRNLSIQFVKQKFPDLIKAYTRTDSHSGNQEGDLQDSAPEVLHLVLLKLLTESEEEVGVSERLKQSFVLGLRQDFPRDLVPTVLAPLLYTDMTDISLDKINSDSSTFTKNMMESSLCDSLLELGYGVCGTPEDCRNTLITLGLQEITPTSVARILGMMSRTHTGLNEQISLQSLQSQSGIWNEKEKTESGQVSTWNVECFVHTLEDLVPTLNWNDVVSELDYPGFHVKDRQGLKVIIAALNLGLRGHSFPVGSFYKPWENTEGQLSLVQQILKNPDIFCWTEHQCHHVNTEVLKSQPENDSKDITTWKSLDLVELLLHLGEAGHHNKVLELFKFPLQHCPDILILSILQVNQHAKNMKKELLSSLIPIFLGNHPNSAVILHYAWHSQLSVTRHIMMHVMAEWYVSGDGDQQRLSRILDIAQDLKALSLLLNINTAFQFTMDLACLASRREYLKLEKWLSDQLLDHGERFASECVKFLHRRCPQIMGGLNKDDLLLGKGSQLPPETLATLLAGLQSSASNFSQELSETVTTMVGNCNLLLSRSRQPPPGVKPAKPLDTTFNNNVIGNSVNSNPVDFIPSISSGIANMSIGGNSGSASIFNLPGILNQFNNPPASPQRLIGPTSAPTPSNTSQSLLSNLGVPHLTQHMASNGAQIGLNNQSKAPLSPLARMSSSFPTANSVTGVERVRQGDLASLFPELTVARDIEDEANGYFQRIYTQPPHLTIDEVLEILKKFQESSLKRERDVFNCMIKNLFEEYKFFPQYPDKELQITAQLFGGIIEQNLLSYMVLGVALRYVLDALRKPHGSKMYSFGVAALDKFRSRLKEYAQYCQHLASIPHFQEFPAHLIEYVEYGARQMEPPRQPGTILSSNPLPGLGTVTSAGKTVTNTTTTTTSLAKSNTAVGSSRQAASSFRGDSVFKIGKDVSAPKETASPSIANTTNINTLLVATEKGEKVLVPPEVLQDKIGFIFNNLSQMNLSTKCDELRELITEEYWPWVSQYLVMKRVSIEPNFHLLYSNFLDTLKMPDFAELVVKETYRNIKVLLRSDKKIANFSDRSLLKNLGHWLGMLTLARSRPILQIDIDIKALLTEAYHKGQQELLYVVPFVAKVLESCAKNKIFKPPNPWTLGILNVLAELHQETSLKLNLKFEIEVLCKNLNISISSMTPGSVLKDLDRYAKIEFQLSNPKKVDPSPPLPGEDTTTSTAETTPPPSSQATFASTSTPTLPSGVPEPRFSYCDINVSSLSGLEPHIVINQQKLLGCQTLVMLNSSHFKQLVKSAIERAVHDWITPVVERSVKIALFTTEAIIKKDFALDPEESRMRAAAHHMVRTLTAGMAMITCRDHLLVSINNNLKASILSTLRAATPQQKETVDQTVTIISQDNVELACVFVQKTAVEKAIPEIDKRLAAEFEVRKLARNEGRRYCDQYSLTYQAERMPEQIRLKVGGVTQQQTVVYEEFARNIPGFLPVSERDTPLILKPIASYGNDEMGQIFDKILAELEPYMGNVNSDSNGQLKALSEMIDSVALARHSRDSSSSETVVQKAVDGLLEGMSQAAEPEVMARFRDCHLFVLKALQDPRAYGPQWVTKLVTRFLTEANPEVKYNFDAVDSLVRSQLVNLQQYDTHLSSAMDNGMNFMAVSLAMHMVKTYLVDERHNCSVTESDIYNTISVLARIAVHARPPPDGLPALIDIIRNTSNCCPERSLGGPSSLIHSGISQAREIDDPPGLHEKTEYLLHEWVQMYHQPSAGRDSSNAFTVFVHQLNFHGILKSDDYVTRFFKLCTQLCVELCYRALNESNSTSPSLVRAKCFHNLDPFVRLTALLVKHSGDTHNIAKINILNKVLGLVAGVLLQDQELRGTEFQSLPYHRILIMLFMELNVPDQVFESINMQVLTAFCKVLHILCPSKAPGFAYSWLEIVAHRMFIYRMMVLSPQQTSWAMYAQLLIDLFKFLAPFLRNADLAKPVMLLYKGTLRVLLVLLHDFPEFLCDYHYGFCDVIPPNCIQMRNLILSAFPRNMRLPDPFTPNLKVDMLPEISHQPRILANFAAMIQPLTFKRDLDSYLKTRSPVTFLSELRSNLQVSNEPGLHYNIPLINALVLYVGTQAINYIISKGHTPSMTTVPHSSHMDIFQNLAVDLNTEGRYLFLNAIANQLRYPNCHTHYFSCTLLYLFAEANNEAIQEQITRVLIERLIVNRPHPWGLLITFIELIKNPSFKFWGHEFVRCAPEIEKLFDSVARSCMVQKQLPSNRDSDSQE